ncbi:uncharacterized protein B0H64DRAFT_435852 [Chaetomium fimeti]|uniref:Uncharacterized protein n=1 Tax=Chaetomium fimeti TaxID=1854472 RepID=A0AAE0H7Y6_9PEZI|nr:hypothetical protein B0H64DRAFT_435852 [Chaetomium fimeti]
MDVLAAEEPAEQSWAIGVGIDFGTTYSSMVFIDSRKKRFVCVRQYPGHGDHTYVNETQVPSAVAADAGNPPGPGHPRWGFLAPVDMTTFRLFKLGIVHPEYLPNGLSNSDALIRAQRVRTAHQVTPSQVTEAFFRGFWATGLQLAAPELGMSVDELRAATLLVAMGNPANWPRVALGSLEEAASNAGIGGSPGGSEFAFLSEPEADLINFIEGNAISTDFTIGDIVGICDVGGGTVDGGAYESRTSQPPFIFRECVAGDSRLAGTILLDDRFFDLVKLKITDRATPSMLDDITSDNMIGQFGRFWESDLKKHYNGTGTRSVEVPYLFRTWQERSPAPRAAGGPPMITFTHQELQALFNPGVDHVLDLIRDQTDAVVAARGRLPKVLVLCGGFSGNPYLRSRVRACVDELNHIHQGAGVQGETRVEHVSGGVDRMVAVAGGCAYHALGLRNFHDTARICSRVCKDTYSLTLQVDGQTPIQRLINQTNPGQTQGDDLSLNDPTLVRVDLAAIGLDIRAKGNIGLVIYRNMNQAVWPIPPGKKRCVIRFRASGAAKVRTANEPGVIEIRITYSWGNVLFHVLVDGAPLTAGIEVDIQNIGANL